MHCDFFPWLYDLVMCAVERGQLSRWRRSVVHPARGLVLEVGAGTGLNFPYYASGSTVVAIDPDCGMLGRARARAEASDAAVFLVAADAEALPFRSGLFDTAVIGLALCTIARPERALAEVQRTMQPGAAVRLLEHVRSRNQAIAVLQDLLTPVWRRLAGGCHLNRDSVGAITRSGMELEQVRSHAAGYVVEVVARTPAVS